MTHPDTGPFREPVDWRGLELFDYPEIIKKMMDLGTIQKKLERNQYNTAWEVAQDIRLVWNNCTCVFVCVCSYVLVSSLFEFDPVGGLLPRLLATRAMRHSLDMLLLLCILLPTLL